MTRCLRPTSRIAIAITAAVALLVAGYVVSRSLSSNRSAEPPQSVAVAYVIDGDTITITDSSGDIDTVRILGINTPEDSPTSTECGGPEATAFLTDLLPAGVGVRLSSDPSQPARDRYDRRLAYVDLDDGTDIGLALVAAGYARPYTVRAPPQRVEQYVDAAQDSQDAGVGLWGKC